MKKTDETLVCHFHFRTRQLFLSYWKSVCLFPVLISVCRCCVCSAVKRFLDPFPKTLLQFEDFHTCANTEDTKEENRLPKGQKCKWSGRGSSASTRTPQSDVYTAEDGLPARHYDGLSSSQMPECNFWNLLFQQSAVDVLFGIGLCHISEHRLTLLFHISLM